MAERTVTFQKRSAPGLVLIGESDNGNEALELYRKHQPDVVTMDFRLPGVNGVECTALIREEFPDARVLLLSIFEGSEDIWRAMEARGGGISLKIFGDLFQGNGGLGAQLLGDGDLDGLPLRSVCRRNGHHPACLIPIHRFGCV